jgi:uncharacterized membrane protein
MSIDPIWRKGDEMKFSWRTEILPVACILAMFALAGIAWPHAPESIPIHWGISGEPDNYAGKFFGLFGAPLIAVGVYVLVTVLPRLDPRKENYGKFWSKYLVIRTVIILVLTAIKTVTFLWVMGVSVNMSAAVFMIVGFLLIILGNYMGKLRPTWFVGIRSPWTLSSDESWDKTHRLGGWLFVIVGLGMVVAAPFQEKIAFYIVGGAGAACILFLYAYSYLVWKHDPGARPAGTGIKRG